MARGRLKDAEILMRGRRFDGAVYLCGYAVELAMKARICTVLNWAGFPETTKEFANLASFRTHNLAILLRLSGREHRIRSECLTDWSVVAEWNPESRYRMIGTATKYDARNMIESTRNLLKVL
jgi:HEPN domain-containing protein